MTTKSFLPSAALGVVLLIAGSTLVTLLQADTLENAQISEFLTRNNDGIRDEDGDREDWIEIWNTSGASGDLGGWYLTDDPTNLTKWTFPAVEMAFGDYLVVFASGKNRNDAAGQLHTNFRLQREAGGYLALVKPDGSTIATEYADYPEQADDIAYGQSPEGPTPVTFFSAGAPAKWQVPTGPLPGWTETGFDDASWNSGATGIGYDGPGGSYFPLIGAGGNTRSEMFTKNASVYIRIPFEVTEPAKISNLALRLKWEDGFVAHLNGTEFHREGITETPAWNSNADGNRDEDDAQTFFEYPINDGSLVTGTNILAIQGINNASGSADLLIVPELVGTTRDPNNFEIGYLPNPSPGQDNTIRYDGLVKDTNFSVDRGVFDTPFDLEITTATEGATIRYTTDGSPPSETAGEIYSGPIRIDGTTVIRALACKEGFQSTNVDTQTYLFPDDVYGDQLADALTAYPTISIVTQTNYDLRLMSVSSTADLPSRTNSPPESSQVIVARVGGELHIRIIDVHIRRNRETDRFEYRTVVDKSAAQLENGPEKTELLSLLNRVPFPEADTLPPESQREIIQKALTASDHTPRIPFVQDSNNDYIEHKSSVEMIYPDGTRGFQEEAGLANFGGGFTNFDKKSFRLYFRGRYGATKLEHPVFDGFEYPNFPPVDEFDAIDLRSGSHDMTNRGAYMAARFCDDSMLEMGQLAPHGRYVHVYLNGRFWGQYHLRERWNADMGASYFGGEKEDYDAVAANNNGMEFQTGTIYDGTPGFWNETRSLLRGPDPFANAGGHIDIPNVVDFMLLWTSGECESEFRAFGSKSQNVPFKFMMRDPDGFMPAGSWNHDHAVTHNGPLNAMTELRTGGNQDYNILLADRIHKHFFNDGALTAEKSVARLRRRFEEMRPGFPAEARRWNYQTVGSWENYVNFWLNTGLPQRTTSMIQRLRQAGMYPDILAPALSQHGGFLSDGAGVTMRTNAPAIYYTMNGSDPRLPGGEISPTAINAAFSNGVRNPEDFVVSGDVWKYLDDGSDQGTAWKESDFDDSGWQSGPSQLGYGEFDLATTIGFIDTDPAAPGIQKNATSYFRREIDIENPSDFSYFLISLRYDDGAAVYLNGVEVVRTDTLPAGAAFDTFATDRTPSESTYFDYQVPTSRLVDGRNVIAVEVHNENPGSSDVRFDLRLRGEIDLSNGNNITEPITFDGPTQFRARAFNSGTNEWSALTETFFSPDTIPADASNLVISEIHYRPADPVSAEETAISTDRDDFEFIELLNTADRSIDLSGLYFDDGINFHFPNHTILAPGQRLVVVKDLAAFTARYGLLPEGTVVGEYGGRLSNDGERIVLRQPGRLTLIDLTYNDQLPWPPEADGTGFSMIFTGSDQAEASSWSAHSEIGGRPGEPDAPLTGGYARWKAGFGITDDDRDDDGDGLSAFAEYATGGHPFVADQGTLFPGGVVTVDAQGYASITYRQSLAANDVIFRVQESEDLAVWTDASNPQVVSESVDPDHQTRTVTTRLPNPVTSGTRKFLRIRIFR